MTAKILVVDDEIDLESLIRQRFRKKIRNHEYDFCFAHNGADALSMVAADPDIDMVLSDINMPVMDGLTLLTRLKQEAPLVKSVIVSAYGDLTNIRTAMNRGAFDFITKPIDFSDLGITIEKTLEHVFQVKDNLQALKENNILKMYVDESVLQYMGGENSDEFFKSNQIIEATVAFIDLNKFTSISEHAKPDFVVDLLNGYFDLMVQSVIDQNGYIDKFIGDAIMAVFRGEDHLQNAIRCALDIKNRISQEPTIDGEIPFTPCVSIGIKSGEMLAGNIGSATLKRLDYTVIGDTVNTAARMQTAANENQVLVGESEYNQVKDHFQCKEVGELALKNRKVPIVGYEIIS